MPGLLQTSLLSLLCSAQMQVLLLCNTSDYDQQRVSVAEHYCKTAVKHIATGLWSRGHVRSGTMDNILLSGRLMDKAGFGKRKRTAASNHTLLF